ncbi:MAG: hypothetical protein ACLFMV_03615, partial [Spirochaetaceae bacterium]
WASGRWRKVELDTAAGKIYVDGDEAGSLDAKPGAGAGKLSFLELSFTPTDGTDGAESGTLYFDEVHWAQTRVSLSGASRLSATYEYPDTVLRAGDVEILSDVRVAQDASVRTGGLSTESALADGAGSFFTRTELAGDLLYTRLSTDVQVAMQDERTSVAGGHSLRIPAADSPVVFTEAFRRNYNAATPSLYRENGLLLSLPAATTLRFDTDARLREENLDQSWDLRAESEPGERLDLGLSTGLGHDAAGYDPGEPSYPASWILAYELAAPYAAGDSPTRTGEAAAELNYAPEPVGFEIDTEGSFDNRSSTEREQRNTAALRIALPLSFAPDSPRSFTLTPSYERRFSRTIAAPQSSSYAEDLRLYGNAFGEQYYTAASVPVAELFRSARQIGFTEHTAGEPFTRYTPKAGITLSRSFGSRLRDLYLPADARVEVERVFAREEEAVTENQRYTARYTATAVNLFGRVGAYPSFDIYRTDEFSNSLSATIDRGFPADETTVSGEASSRTILFGEGDNEFRMRTSAEGEYDEEQLALTAENETSYLWQQPAERIFGLERLVEDRPPHYEHTERLLLRYDASAGEEPERTYSLTVGHETRLVFPEQGFIRVYADLGTGLQPVVIDGEDVTVTLLGLQGGIEGRLEF